MKNAGSCDKRKVREMILNTLFTLHPNNPSHHWFSKFYFELKGF